MSGVKVDRSVNGGLVWTVTIDRPNHRNAVNGPAAKALFEVFSEFNADKKARVAVLCGANGTFCAGADLKAVADKTKANPTKPSGMGPMGCSRMQLDKPVIAAISGFAVAGGLELACWCDMRVVEEDATFGVFCRRWGVPLIDGGTVRLPRLIGQSRAMDMILTGRPVGAAEALRFGLANRVVPKGKARQAAEQLASELCTFPQETMLSDRASSLEQWSLPYDNALQNEFVHGFAVLGVSQKGAEKFAAGAGRGGSFDEFKAKANM
mmetsp:Transcript_11550/g.13264  ORF Transcript_11550/g.13264 Transcript_11550/m.13264 type:complete len:266 (-) Transcript_11550:645-1442(-)|eukprot:CAMPEP_0184009340 /NCGR_PEP_ID=MMETSP0954-20121128/2531_1 /TAXON_ID=627963 /ORGANISM="Aplanochytrium sp, Strain PBS07" /LENGTH=265 /DNA_ID=CAMNT_0026288663 /DNA_START=128 /DNA_END=925 /DNA_ORIENTATION=-